RRQRAAGVAAAIAGLCKYGEGPLFNRFHNDIVGLGNSYTKLIHWHWLDILTVRSHHRHLQAWNSNIKQCHCGRIDKAQPDLLSWLEHTSPARVRGYAVHQESIGIASHIGQIRLTHAHPVPHGPVSPGLNNAFLFYVLPEVADSPFVEVIVVTDLFEFCI